MNAFKPSVFKHAKKHEKRPKAPPGGQLQHRHMSHYSIILGRPIWNSQVSAIEKFLSD